MFTGIIETTGTITDSEARGTNISFWIESVISDQLKPDQSVCHDGICLTVERISDNRHKVTAIKETIKKTTLASWNTGTLVNLERCLQLNSRLDGHIVQGHVDNTAVCLGKKEKAGSWELEFGFPKKFGPLVIEKGSVAINGISLTAFNVKKKSFRVAIIPYTFEHTNIKQVAEGSVVNIEFDIIGKYLLRSLTLKL